MYDVVALGELLIDFIPGGTSPAGNVMFEQNPGGAPANVLAALSKMGGSGAFIGMVGKDQFGLFLKSVLEKERIESKGLKFSDQVNTTLAFVHLDREGDRSFSFYRKPGADTQLQEKDIEYSLIDNTGIFHFGSLSLTAEPSKNATIKAVEYAKNKGKVISYDPNWRPPLWESDIAAKTGMLIGLKYADILKVSGEELEFLTGCSDLEEGSKILLNKGIKVVIVTLGKKGCYFRCKSGTGHLNTYDTGVIDTTGAGDAFLGSFLFRLSRTGIPMDRISRDELGNMIDFSNAAGAVCASRSGAIPAMPSVQEVEECLGTIPKLVLEL